MTTITDLLEAHPTEVATATNIHEFLDLVDHPKTFRKYADNNRFLTHKHHGYTSRVLRFPEATSVKELIDDAKMVDFSKANGLYRADGILAKDTIGYAFMSGLGIVPFGAVGYTVEIIESQGKFFCVSQRGRGCTLGTYVRPTFYDGSPMDFSTAYSFEAVERATTVLLALRADHHTEWLAIFEKGQFIADVWSLISPEQLVEYDRNKALVAAAQSCRNTDDTINYDLAAEHGIKITIR